MPSQRIECRRGGRDRASLSTDEIVLTILICFTALAIGVVYSALLNYDAIAGALGPVVSVALGNAAGPGGARAAAEGALPLAPGPDTAGSIAPGASMQTTPVEGEPPAAAPPTRLSIPKLGLDVPVQPVGYKTVVERGASRLIWDTPRDVAGFHQSAAYPGERGNVVINGHRDLYSAVFRHLDALQEGDRIVLYAGDTPYAYQVIGSRILPYVGASVEDSAEHARLLGPTQEARLTLVTCTPVALATHRLYVIATPIKD
ncbi:MAG: sortase [Anaerolineae bacterium]|nr:sortase [Anaerolineae bacterium]